MRVESLAQVAITASDVSTMLVYYRDVIGLPFLFAPNNALAFLQAGEVRLMITEPQGEGTAGLNSVLYYGVNQIQETFASIVARGGIVEREPELAASMPDHDLWIAFLRDPEGNLVGLMEELAR